MGYSRVDWTAYRLLVNSQNEELRIYELTESNGKISCKFSQEQSRQLKILIIIKNGTTECCFNPHPEGSRRCIKYNGSSFNWISQLDCYYAICNLKFYSNIHYK